MMCRCGLQNGFEFAQPGVCFLPALHEPLYGAWADRHMPPDLHVKGSGGSRNDALSPLRPWILYPKEILGWCVFEPIVNVEHGGDRPAPSCQCTLVDPTLCGDV